MIENYVEHLSNELRAVREAGLYKAERTIASPQQAEITLADGTKVINFCANNYLGLSDHPALVAAGQKALSEYGYGMSSVRFICGTQTIHQELERRISDFLKMDDCILYPSCFDANTGLFETLLDERDAIISDALNHASIIDGIRLCKARRFRYANNDMGELEEHLKASQDARFRLIATDGVFSMDGIIANLSAICDLAEKYDALVMVDDSHAVGFMGEHGRGTPEHCGVEGRIHILTGTLGKALGGGSGGYTATRPEIVEWLRQKSRPYLFSNSVAPVIVGASLEALSMLEDGGTLRNKLRDNTKFFRREMKALGFELSGTDHPIAPIMLGDAKLASEMAEALLAEGIYVIGFSFPVVPKGQARIRTQLSAAHEPEHLEKAIAAFAKVGRQLGVIS